MSTNVLSGPDLQLTGDLDSHGRGPDDWGTSAAVEADDPEAHRPWSSTGAHPQESQR